MIDFLWTKEWTYYIRRVFDHLDTLWQKGGNKNKNETIMIRSFNSIRLIIIISQATNQPVSQPTGQLYSQSASQPYIHPSIHTVLVVSSSKSNGLSASHWVLSMNEHIIKQNVTWIRTIQATATTTKPTAILGLTNETNYYVCNNYCWVVSLT